MSHTNTEHIRDYVLAECTHHEESFTFQPVQRTIEDEIIICVPCHEFVPRRYDLTLLLFVRSE